MKIDEKLLKNIKKHQKNFGYMFYKFDANENEKYGRSLINEGINELYTNSFKIPNADYFTLKTKAPGLIIGSGYPHFLRDEKDFKIGFYFDHTFGLPVISGSSIKGMLRSFIDFKRNPQKKEFMEESFKDIDFKELLNVFENELDKKIIFYDAFISKTNNEKIFDFDYITPHKNPFQDPKPLRFLKLLNNVEFTFQFQFINFNSEEKDKILNLFKFLIKKFGIGAKTRKNYGRFK